MESKQAVIALSALAQETRLAVFRLLVQIGPATLSFHLKEMTHAGLIEPRQAGRYIYYAANFERMNELLGFLTESCCASDGVSCAVPALGARQPERQVQVDAKSAAAPRTTKRRSVAR
jgi:DNA-binding transcriptional ArsR family regulator